LTKVITVFSVTTQVQYITKVCIITLRKTKYINIISSQLELDETLALKFCYVLEVLLVLRCFWTWIWASKLRIVNKRPSEWYKKRGNDAI